MVWYYKGTRYHKGLTIIMINMKGGYFMLINTVSDQRLPICDNVPTVVDWSLHIQLLN